MSRTLCVRLRLCAATFLLAALSAIASAQSAPSVQLVPVLSGLSAPVLATSARDSTNRLFIVEQSGRIKILPAGASAPLATPFIDLSTKILYNGEQGLLGLAFHPQYAINRRFFVNYTRKGDGATVVSEFRASASDINVAATDERILLTIAQPYTNHNGGMIAFGPDGFLYIGMGDGGSGNDPENRAQNIESLLGKILRIDVDTTSGGNNYAVPASNPFVNKAGLDEIYAVGVRNPWRWSFDRQTGELWAGDVGQNVVEEVDLITLGGNFGWRVLEGTRCTNLGPGACTDAAYTAPIIEYDHATNGRCSITGGYVYRGTRGTLPAGTYVYGDYCSGEIFTWSKGQARTAINVAIDTSLSISSFGEDEAGELYVIALGGTLYRIAAPTAATTVSAANYRGAPLATEAIVAAFGTGLATATQSAPGGTTLPTTLAGLTVRVTDAAGTTRNAPLFFVSPTQVNYLVPAGTVAGNATVSFTTANGVVATSTATIASIAPGIFTANATGRDVPAAVVLRVRGGAQSFESVARFDQGQNRYVSTPINLGPETDEVFLVLFGTGFRFRSALSGVTATIGGIAAPVTFAGAQGQLAGLDQANLRIPRALIGRGEVDVVFSVDGLAANTVRVSIQ